MPPSAESKHEQIAARLETLLASIVAGSDFWYTPDMVARVEGFWEEYFADEMYPTLYLLRPGDEPAAEDTAEEIKKEMDVWLVVAQVYKPKVTDNPFLLEGVLPWTIQSRLIFDAEKKLLEDCTMGLSFVENTEIRDRNRAFFIDGYIAAELRLVIKYSHLREEP